MLERGRKPSSFGPASAGLSFAMWLWFSHRLPTAWMSREMRFPCFASSSQFLFCLWNGMYRSPRKLGLIRRGEISWLSIVFLQGSNAELLTSLEALMNDFFSPCTTNDRKREIENLLNNFKQQQNAWSLSLWFLNHSSNDYVRIYCLTTLEVRFLDHVACDWPL